MSNKIFKALENFTQYVESPRFYITASDDYDGLLEGKSKPEIETLYNVFGKSDEEVDSDEVDLDEVDLDAFEDESEDEGDDPDFDSDSDSDSDFGSVFDPADDVLIDEVDVDMDALDIDDQLLRDYEEEDELRQSMRPWGKEDFDLDDTFANFNALNKFTKKGNIKRYDEMMDNDSEDDFEGLLFDDLGKVVEEEDYAELDDDDREFLLDSEKELYERDFDQILGLNKDDRDYERDYEGEHLKKREDRFLSTHNYERDWSGFYDPEYNEREKNRKRTEDKLKLDNLGDLGDLSDFDDLEAEELDFSSDLDEEDSDLNDDMFTEDGSFHGANFKFNKFIK